MYPCEVFGEFDEVLVTGEIFSDGNHFVDKLPCMIATVYQLDRTYPAYIDKQDFKCWPLDENDPQLDPIRDSNGGKLWFNFSHHRTKVEVVRKEGDGLDDF